MNIPDIEIKQRLEYLKGYYAGLSEQWTYEEDLRIKAKIEELENITDWLLQKEEE